MRDKKVLVVGLGKSGKSAAQFLLARQAHVWGVDTNRELLNGDPEIQSLLEKGGQFQHEGDPLDVGTFDLVVLSPGIASTHPLITKAKKMGLPVIGEAELAFQNLAHHKVLGITGTNGKTTVTLLITHILNQSGIAARPVGNVGTPLTSELLHPVEDVLVTELSSFQLETLSTPILDGAAILNITSDHLDRYPSFEEYAKAKCRIQECLKPQAPLYVEEKTAKNFSHLFKTRFCQRYEGSLMPSLQGKPIHEIENILAAYALCSTLGVASEQFLHALASFIPPPHRLEFITKIGGVSYYNDSKATNVDAVVKAVQAIRSPIILIAGGVDKQSSYAPWVSAFRGKVKRICALGQAAKKIEEELTPICPVYTFPSLEICVAHATHIAQPGDCVLLSPGCASYDMFQNYEHRGEVFKSEVRRRTGYIPRSGQF